MEFRKGAFDFQTSQQNPKINKEILKNLCYTDLVYTRINKKLGVELSKMEIELLICDIVKDNSSTVIKKGKNYYIKNIKKHIQVTVNSNNYRVITADKIL